MSAEGVRAEFRARYDAEPEVVTRAPGRVNLIGEHTDYNDGFVFPAAIDREVFLAAQTSQGKTTLFSLELGAGQEFDSADLQPGSVQEWARYAAGMAWALGRHGQVPNIRGVVHGEVPIGGGISSSAAIEMAFGVAYNHLAALGLGNKELAKLGQVCENQYIGLSSGIMDQMASAMGKAGNAMLLDTRSLDIRYVPIPGDVALVICDTGKARALTESAYNERRSQCEEAAGLLGVKALRDATLTDLDRAGVSELTCRRARHVISENQRCLDFVAALEAQDYAAIGRLMRESHISLRDDYEVSCPELDAMAESAWRIEGCIGARMTGAGFGGACVAMVLRGAAEEFTSELATAYEQRTGLTGAFLVCETVDGAGIVED